MSNQGVEEKHRSNYTQDYFTDRVKDEAVNFIKDSANSSEEVPFFMYVSTPAPHRPATPAPQYSNMFSDEIAPRPPSYRYVGADKHWIISKGIIIVVLNKLCSQNTTERVVTNALLQKTTCSVSRYNYYWNLAIT